MQKTDTIRNPELQAKQTQHSQQGICSMTWQFIKISVPLILRQNLMYLVLVINVIFSGRLGDPAKTAGVGLGTTMNHIFGCCILFGLNRAMDTLISQAYGAGNLGLCGVYLNRARIIGTIAFIPVTLICMNCEVFLLWFSQDPKTVEFAAKYTRQMIPALYFMNLCDQQAKFLTFMQSPNSVMIAQAITTTVHAPLCYYFVEKRGLDVVGLSYASLVSFSCEFVYLLIFTYCKKSIKDAFQLPYAAAFRDWGSYLDLALPAVLNSCSDWWAFEILIFISGYVGVTQQAAFVILQSITSQIFMVPFGISTTACTLIGSAIGQQDVPMAKRWFKLISIYTLLYGLSLTFVLLIFRKQVAMIFTDDQEVRALIIHCMPIVAIKFIPHGYQGLLGLGLIPALGMQREGSYVTLSVAYLVTVPAACLYAFVLNHGIVGLLWGAATGNICQAAGFATFILSKDWYQVSREAAERIQKDDDKNFDAQYSGFPKDDNYVKV